MTDRDQNPGSPPGTADRLGRRIAARVGRRRALARGALVWEQLWRAGWPAACVAGLFLALAGLDVLPVLPAWLHAAVLAGFALWFGLALFAGVRRFHTPDSAAAERRLEHDSGVDHRPLVTLGDRIAGGAGDAASERLWQVHLERALAVARRLRVRLPRPGLAGRDPHAFRFAVLLALVVAAAAAHEDPQARLARAFAPDLSGTAAIPAASLEVWVTPPEYTGLPPRLLTNEPAAADAAAEAAAPGRAAAPVAVPAGSQILAQLNDGRGEPALTIGDETLAFRSVGERNWRLEVTAETKGAALRQTRIGVRQGGEVLADWPLVIAADKTPIIEFASPPEASRRMALKIEYRALDDFGITGVVARLTRPAAEATPRDGTMELPLPMTGRNMRDGGTATFHDLTAHPWAGLDVEIALEARDALDQVGSSDRLTLTLPERAFNHPVAREIIDPAGPAATPRIWWSSWR